MLSPPLAPTVCPPGGGKPLGRRFRLDDAFGAHALDLVDQFAAHVEGLDVIPAADALAVDEHVGHGASAGGFGQGGLQAGAQGVRVEFHHEGRGHDGVFLEQDVLGFGRVGAVGFGKDDN